MKPFTVNEIVTLLEGVLVKGSSELLIHHAAVYMEALNYPHTLFFLRRKFGIDLSQLTSAKYSPCVLVTDQINEKIISLENLTIIKVRDIETAYWRFVDHYRLLFKIPVIAITGTSGKTTTKEMIKHILMESRNVVATGYSANGRTGHFLYLTRIDESTEVGVFETAVGAPGDLTHSFRFFKPTIGIMTNIGVDHLDMCKTVEGYIKAKAEMFNLLPPDGILIINNEDKTIKKAGVENFKGRIVTFGTDERADFRASTIQYDKAGMKFSLTLHNMKYSIYVPGFGCHQVYNALAALAAVHELGIGINEAAQSLCTFKNMMSHLEITQGINGSLLINDTWNINPTSLEAAFNTLADLAQGRKKIALIGSIKALGNITTEIEQDIGCLIASTDIDIFLAIGPMSQGIITHARTQGFKGELYAFPETSGVLEFLETIIDKNTMLLAKCSMFDTPFKELLSHLTETPAKGDSQFIIRPS